MDDKLREMARQAVADADANGPGGVRMQAVKLLRERDDKRGRMQDYVGAVNWAMERPTVADLPTGSVVADSTNAFIKNRPAARSQWSCTDGAYATDEYVDRQLDLGARVLRVGTREG